MPVLYASERVIVGADTSPAWRSQAPPASNIHGFTTCISGLAELGLKFASPEYEPRMRCVPCIKLDVLKLALPLTRFAVQW